MDIIFLGYSLINFTNDDGQHIDGLKFYFAHESDKSNYSGLQVDSYFVDRQNQEVLYSLAQKCIPLNKYILDLIPSFNGKTRIKAILQPK